MGSLEQLKALGVEQRGDGSIVFPPEALKALRVQRVRESAVSSVPSTPRIVTRDAGGVGVRKGSNKFDALSFESLRMIRERSPVCKAIHAARQKQLIRLSREWSGKRGEIGWRVVHKDHYEWNAKPPKGFERYIDQFKALIKVPSPSYCTTTSNLLVPLWEDYATLNRPVVEKLTSPMDSSFVVGYRPVDAGLIWNTNLFIEKWVRDNSEFALLLRNRPTEERKRIFEDLVGHNLLDSEYCLVREGVVESVFPRGKLVIGTLQTRTDVSWNGYPPGMVEDATEMLLSFINTWKYNTTFFTSGMMSEFILGISGDVLPEDVAAFIDQLREASKGVERAWQPPVIELPDAGTIQKIDLKNNPKEMGFEGWMGLLLSLGCAVYRMDPSTINAKGWDGGSGPSLSAPNREKEVALAKEEGLQGDVSHLIDAILNPLAQGVHPDLRFVMEFGDFDPQKEAAIYEVQGRTIMTRNEIRLAQGLVPMGFWKPPEELAGLSEEHRQKYDENIWNWPTDSTFASQASQQIYQRKQEQAAKEQAAQGQPDGFGGRQGPPDGFGGDEQEQEEEGQGSTTEDSSAVEPGAPPPPKPGGPLSARKGTRRTVFVVEEGEDAV